MNTPPYSFGDLFSQLGLPSDEGSVARFLATHGPLASHIMLPEAPFWTPAQATFLRESILEDAEWAEPVDRLNEALRHR